MKILGLIVEYNPFHQGHLHHLNQAKAIVNPDLTIAIMSGNFVQRGEPAIISKFDRANIAINHGCDLVVELPLVHAVQSANQFAHGAIKLLSELQVTDVVFGSESGDIAMFKEIAASLKESPDYHEKVKELLKTGISYSDACNQALEKLDMPSITTPNDLLGLAYTKEVLNNFPHINLHCIKRSNSYHEKTIAPIPSATSLRLGIYEQRNLDSVLICPEYFHQDLFYLEDLFPLLKYNLITKTPAQLAAIHLVDEGIENLMHKNIMACHNMHDFVNSLTSKRYSRSRIQRTIVHILLNNTRQDVNAALKLDFIRILKASPKGFGCLKDLREQTDYKIITNFSSHDHHSLAIEGRAAALLSLISKSNDPHIREIANNPKASSSFLASLDIPDHLEVSTTGFYGVCFNKGMILMMKDENGACYFPGGLSDDWDYHQFLKVQIPNLTNIQVGQIQEFLGLVNQGKGTHMNRSFYYLCQVKLKNISMHPSCRFVPIAQALEANKMLVKDHPVLAKEIAVLEKLSMLKN